MEDAANGQARARWIGIGISLGLAAGSAIGFLAGRRGVSASRDSTAPSVVPVETTAPANIQPFVEASVRAPKPNKRNDQRIPRSWSEAIGQQLRRLSPSWVGRQEAGPYLDVPVRKQLLVGALLALIVVAEIVRQAQPPNGFQFWLIPSLLWLFAMIAYPAAFLPARWLQSTRADLRRVSAADVASVLVITALAAAPRLWNLSDLPHTVSGDEAQAALAGRNVLEGRVVSPFTSVPVALGFYPSIASFGQAGLMWLFGDHISAARSFSALAGVAAVVATYVLARVHFDRGVALAAAVIMATLPSHLFWSRFALTNVLYTLAIVVSLGLSLLALRERRAWMYAAAGLAIGLSQYTYQGARVILAIVALVLLVDLVDNRARLGVWMSRMAVLTGGVLVAFLPLLVNYLQHPSEVMGRVNQVSIFASGWLNGEIERTGTTPFQIVPNLVMKTFLAYVSESTRSFYEPGRALLPPIGTLTLVLGMLLCIRGARDRAKLTMIVAFAMIIVSVSLTENTPNSARIMIADPIVTVIMAVGSVSITRWAFSGHAKGSAIASSMVVGYLAFTGVSFYFRDFDDILDGNSATQSEIAYFMRGHPVGTRFLFAGMPRVSCRTHASIQFLAPDRECVDIPPRGTQVASPPVLSSEIVIAVPERRDEIATELMVQGRHAEVVIGRDPRSRDRSFAFLPR